MIDHFRQRHAMDTGCLSNLTNCNSAIFRKLFFRKHFFDFEAQHNHYHVCIFHMILQCIKKCLHLSFNDLYLFHMMLLCFI